MSRRKSTRKKKKRTALPPPQPELNEASRAQLGRDEEKRPYRPRQDDASIEDPLKDWPEDGGPQR
jgi:hypothetical protein